MQNLIHFNNSIKQIKLLKCEVKHGSARKTFRASPIISSLSNSAINRDSLSWIFQATFTMEIEVHLLGLKAIWEPANDVYSSVEWKYFEKYPSSVRNQKRFHKFFLVFPNKSELFTIQAKIKNHFQEHFRLNRHIKISEKRRNLKSFASITRFVIYSMLPNAGAGKIPGSCAMRALSDELWK